jgi:hypothetical protein
MGVLRKRPPYRAKSRVRFRAMVNSQRRKSTPPATELMKVPHHPGPGLAGQIVCLCVLAKHLEISEEWWLEGMPQQFERRLLPATDPLDGIVERVGFIIGAPRLPRTDGSGVGQPAGTSS